MAKIELRQCYYDFIPEGHIADTGVMGPCTGIVIHDSHRQEAYAAHFTDSETDGLEEMVDESLERFDTPRELDVYVCGNSLSETENEELAEYEKRDRKFVLDTFRRKGFLDSRIYVKWSPDFCDARLTFNVNSGENQLTIDEYSGEGVYEGRIQDAPEFKSEL